MRQKTRAKGVDVRAQGKDQDLKGTTAEREEEGAEESLSVLHSKVRARKSQR